jgi:hypothetical protein
MAGDNLTLTIRVHDPFEKEDAEKAASWATISVLRADIGISKIAFAEKYLQPALAQLKSLELT